MRAVVIREYGSAAVLEERNVACPKPGHGEILVEVHACGLNPVDYKIRQGHLQELFPVSFPRILGGDISGVVAEVGPEASDFNLGDEVYFSNPLDRDGGYAEFCVVDQKLVARKPPSLSHFEAASLPVVGLTSIQAMRDFGGVGKGETVLIHAGAGGVGSFAIQYAKVLGAKVFVTASRENAHYVMSLGADRVIDYRTEDFVDICQKAGGMDFVFETIGGTNFPQSILAAKRGGIVPCVVNAPDSDTLALAELHDVKTGFMLLRLDKKDLELISEMVERQMIRPTVSRLLTLDKVRDGHAQLESGRTQGKIVVRIH